MRTFSTSLRVRDNQLWILNQQMLLPQQLWHPAESVAQLVDHIRALLIGLSASLLLAEGGAAPGAADRSELDE